MPYCPLCLRERSEETARCPLDRSFFVESPCPGCGAEVLPREHYCGACGARQEEHHASVHSPLSPASRSRRALALVVDILALLTLLPMALELWDQPWVVVLLSTFYFVLLETGGRQTLGQLVTGCVVLDERWASLRLGAAARRWGAFLLLFPSGLARWPRYDRITHCRTWSSPEL